MGNIKVAGIFSNHMVLQREKEIKVWGIYEEPLRRDNCPIVTVRLNMNQIEVVTADSSKEENLEGKDSWSVSLPPMKAGGPYELVVECEGQKVSFEDVVIGEVWLAGGQSNMELALVNSKDGSKIVKELRNQQIRFYQTPRNSYMDEAFYQDEEESGWEVASSDAVESWSAVGTYFAVKLQEELGVPVGIIGCNWGGTSASAWVSAEKLQQDADLNSYVEEYELAMEGKTFEEYEKELEEYNAWYEVWKKKVDELYADNPKILWTEVQRIAGECRWPEPLGPKSPFRAGGLYETMLLRVCPYSLRGFLYYQGESDDHKPDLYAKLLTELIREWRESWQEEELPFLFVQLPMFINKQEADHGNWAVIRKQQETVANTVSNTAMAVILDRGEFDNIHPTEKKPVGERLAKLALAKVYGRQIAAEGPKLAGYQVVEGRVRIQFANVEEGLLYREDREFAKSRFEYIPMEPSTTVISMTGFEIAGIDRKYVPAELVVDKAEITVFSNHVKEPHFIQYGWHNYSPVTIFNSEGFPLAPLQLHI